MKTIGGYKIDTSSLETFVESICRYIKISRSPGVKSGSTREMYYALWEAEKIFREIRKDLDGPALMKGCIPFISELLYYCENSEEEVPDICFSDPEEALWSFEKLVTLYIKAHYNKISYLIKRVDDGWRYPDEAEKQLQNGQDVLVEKLDGTVTPAKYKAANGVAGFFINGESWCIRKWTPREQPKSTVPDTGKEPPCFIPEENNPYPLCKGCGKEECNACGLYAELPSPFDL